MDPWIQFGETRELAGEMLPIYRELERLAKRYGPEPVLVILSKYAEGIAASAETPQP